MVLHPLTAIREPKLQLYVCSEACRRKVVPLGRPIASEGNGSSLTKPTHHVKWIRLILRPTCGL
jgi:hypothetical protein